MSSAAEFRRRWRLGQQEMAQRLGVHRITVSKWERGRLAEPHWLRLALIGLSVELAGELGVDK